MAKRLKPVELFLALGLITATTACGGPATNAPEGSEDAPAETEEVVPDDGGEEGEEGEEGDEEDEGGEGGEG